MKKLGLIALTLVLVLGLMGIGYAAWTEVLVINGTVNTGNLDATYTTGTNDPAQTNDPLTGQWSGNNGLVWAPSTHAGYDAAMTTIGVVTTNDETSTETNVATITVTDAYPGYKSSVALCITNTGTVPFKGSFGAVYNINHPAAGSESDITFIPGLPSSTTVLDVGQSTTMYLDIVVGNVQETGAYTATVDLTLSQFNN
jgi:hypothetical protein